MFHETLRNILSGIPGVFNIHDDIFVFGKDGAHDIALEVTFRRLRENNVTLSQSKCLFMTLNQSKCLFNTNVINLFRPTLFGIWYESVVA